MVVAVLVFRGGQISILNNQPTISIMTEQEAKKVVDIIVGAGDKERAREMIVRFILHFPDHARIARRMFREKFGEAVVRNDEMARGIIREVIHKIAGEHGVDVEKIILFGSRARGDHTEDSDWDVLVVVRRELPFGEKLEIFAKIKKILAQFEIMNDIVIKSSKVVSKEERDAGYLSYYILKEGVEL